MSNKVSVIVYDDANPENVGRGNLTVNVRRNEQGPRFDRTDYSENVLETIPIGTTVVTLKAEDQTDRGVSLVYVAVYYSVY